MKGTMYVNWSFLSFAILCFLCGHFHAARVRQFLLLASSSFPSSSSRSQTVHSISLKPPAQRAGGPGRARAVAAATAVVVL